MNEIEEAITTIQGLACNPLFSKKHLKAFETAISSLKGWKNVRAEIYDKLSDYMLVNDYNDGLRFGLMLSFQIIEKYFPDFEELLRKIETESFFL